MDTHYRLTAEEAAQVNAVKARQDKARARLADYYAQRYGSEFAALIRHDDEF